MGIDINIIQSVNENACEFMDLKFVNWSKFDNISKANYINKVELIYINKIACMYICLYVRYRKGDDGFKKKIKTAISCKISRG